MSVKEIIKTLFCLTVYFLVMYVSVNFLITLATQLTSVLALFAFVSGIVFAYPYVLLIERHLDNE